MPKVFIITLGDLDIIELGTHDGSEIVSSECFTDGTADGKFEALLLLFRLGSVAGLEFGIVLGTALRVLDILIPGKYVVIELGSSESYTYGAKNDKVDVFLLLY